MKKSLILTLGGVALSASLLLTGCSTGGAPSGDKAPAAAEKPAAKPTPKSTTAKFGEVFKYDDGVSVSVSAPVAFKPGQYAAGADQAQNIMLTFTIVNGSTKNLNPVALPKVSSAGTEGSAVFDAANTTLAAFAPTTVILPGGKSSWTQGFSVADATKLIVQFSPAPFTYDDAIFTNTQ
jgi:hypothetical protein